MASPHLVTVHSYYVGEKNNLAISPPLILGNSLYYADKEADYRDEGALRILQRIYHWATRPTMSAPELLSRQQIAPMFPENKRFLIDPYILHGLELKKTQFRTSCLQSDWRKKNCFPKEEDWTSVVGLSITPVIHVEFPSCNTGRITDWDKTEVAFRLNMITDEWHNFLACLGPKGQQMVKTILHLGVNSSYVLPPEVITKKNITTKIYPAPPPQEKGKALKDLDIIQNGTKSNTSTHHVWEKNGEQITVPIGKIKKKVPTQTEQFSSRDWLINKGVPVPPLVKPQKPRKKDLETQKKPDSKKEIKIPENMSSGSTCPLVYLIGVLVSVFWLTRILKIIQNADWWWTFLSFRGEIPTCPFQNTGVQTNNHLQGCCPVTCGGFPWTCLRHFIIFLFILVLLLAILFLMGIPQEA